MKHEITGRCEVCDAYLTFMTYFPGYLCETHYNEVLIKPNQITL